MALPIRIFKSNTLLLKIISTHLKSKIFCKYVHNSDSQRTDIDALDVFTTQLLQKKTNRWEYIRIKKLKECKPMMSLPSPSSSQNGDTEENANLDIRNNKNTVEHLINQAIDTCDMKKIAAVTNECLKHKIIPSPPVLQNILSAFAQNGDRNTIILIRKLVEDLDPDQCRLNANYLHYLAEATWVKGNINDALKLFDEVYENFVFLRRRLKLMIKYLIANVISERSEATLVMVINFTENIAKKYDDYFLLACVWQVCFLSEWYADQCRATEILASHEKLCSQIVNRIPYVVNSALKSHQTEVVHRLFELLLKYKMKSQYKFVLQSLFNYRYWQNDLRSCAEIMQWSLNIEVPLSDTQQEQFVALLLNHRPNDKKVAKKIKDPQDFQLKF